MPKRAIYYVQNHKIEIVRTFFGKEKVLLNGVMVSEKAAKESLEHSFTIKQNNYRIIQRKGSLADKMNTYEIRKDNSPVALMNVVQQNSMQILLLIIAVGLGSGFIFGVLLYKMFFPVSV